SSIFFRVHAGVAENADGPAGLRSSEFHAERSGRRYIPGLIAIHRNACAGSRHARNRRRTRIDETPHVHFALDHIRSVLQTDVGLKDSLYRAIANRASILSGMKGLNPLVEESLVILAAGGLSPDRLSSATKSRIQLYETMHEN